MAGGGFLVTVHHPLPAPRADDFAVLDFQAHFHISLLSVFLLETSLKDVNQREKPGNALKDFGRLTQK
jgi:hypothetical protein